MQRENLIDIIQKLTEYMSRSKENSILFNTNSCTVECPPISGIYRVKDKVVMTQAAELLDMKVSTIEEGNDYPLKSGGFLKVHEGDFHIEIQGKQKSDYSVYWDTVKQLKKLAQQV